jgi:hypothetical protein
MPALAVAPAGAVRHIVHRSRGQTHGPITRLMSPGDLGEVLKPFVFLDLFDNGGKPLSGFGLQYSSGEGRGSSLRHRGASALSGSAISLVGGAGRSSLPGQPPTGWSPTSTHEFEPERPIKPPA